MSLLRSLRHNHIVELLSVADMGRYVFTIMEFICGGSLRDILSKVDPAPCHCVTVQPYTKALKQSIIPES